MCTLQCYNNNARKILPQAINYVHIKHCLRHRSDAKALHVVLLKRHWHKKQRQTRKSLITRIGHRMHVRTHTRIHYYTRVHSVCGRGIEPRPRRARHGPCRARCGATWATLLVGMLHSTAGANSCDLFVGPIPIRS